jgi:selenoprotein W-related protein
MRNGQIIIEYCPGCRWMLRASWLCQELLSTFEAELEFVSLKPSDLPGTFFITVNGQEVWERKKDNGFPEAKVLKQRIRDIILPDKDLGHSDK